MAAVLSLAVPIAVKSVTAVFAFLLVIYRTRKYFSVLLMPLIPAMPGTELLLTVSS
jgi:hypothetical protein